MTKGIVYIVKNPAFTHLFKIGWTSKNTVEQRGLDASNIPEDYETLMAFECENPERIESMLHNTFKHYRHYTASRGRKTEFFYIACMKDAIEYLGELKNAYSLKDITAEFQEDVEEHKSDEEYDETRSIAKYTRRPVFNFKEMGIPVGAILNLVKNPKIQLKVLDEKRVEYEDKSYSFSTITATLIKSTNKHVQPTGYWMYNGKNVGDIYNETYPVNKLYYENKNNMVGALTNKEHLDRHTNPKSLTIGSKFLPDITRKEIENFMQKFDDAYLEMINEKVDPGLQVFGIECDKPVGTCAVIPIVNLTAEGKASIFEITRDFGKTYESKERVLLISHEDMPTTNFVIGVYGKNMLTGNVGNMTMYTGYDFVPDQNREYWNNQVFLCTPRELEANIAELRKVGMDTRDLEVRLAEFKGINPIGKPYNPGFAEGVVKLNNKENEGILGLHKDKVALVSYSSKWIDEFQKEKQILKKILGSDALAIEHVGSTAIPGLSAKPIIDIAVAVRNKDVLRKLVPYLSEKGYDFMDSIDTSGEVLIRRGSSEFRTHYIHIEILNSDFWKNHIMFRGYLLKHPECVKEYEELKHKLSIEFKDERKKYTACKNDFIQKILLLAKEGI